jgi:hypothetical protein
MRLSPVATACALLSLVLTLGACGEERPAAVGGPSVERAGAQGAPDSQNGATGGRCGSQMRSLVASLDALRKQLAVGLNYEDYLSEVERLKAVYDEVPVERLAIGCLTTVGAPAERALNRYREAANTWGDCLTRASCDAGAVEPKLQRRWALAASLLSTAQEGLR